MGYRYPTVWAKHDPQEQHVNSPLLDVADLCKKYQNGSTANELAAEFTIHRTSVMNHLERNGIKRRVSKPKLTKQMIYEAKEPHKLGMSYA